MTRTILGAAILALAATAHAQGDVKGDPQRAKEKISMCSGCHGIPDYRTAYPAVYYVPMIAGQNAGYIVKALEAYRSGERNHPSMRAVAASLSPQDMADLAVYYSTTAK
jgi:cytochrome c553